MAKTIGAYKGLWRQAEPNARAEVLERETLADAARRLETNVKLEGAFAVTAAPQAGFETETQGSSSQTSSEPGPDLLAHHYRMLVLRDHRMKLGRQLLESRQGNPWRPAWACLTSFGRSFRPWAHAHIFALGSYLGMDLAPELLQQLRHPLWVGRYRRSMFALWRLLELFAEKNGQSAKSRFLFHFLYWCPPLAVLIYEGQLRAVWRKAHGVSQAMNPALAKAN